MKHLLIFWLSRGIAFCLLLGLLLPTSLAQASGVTVTVDAPTKVTAGDDFTARVNITGVTNFDACDYVVVFDSAVLRLDSVSDGDIGGTTIPVVATKEFSAGRIKVVENVAGTPGVTGSGYLAVLHFHALASGDIDIEFEDGCLSDNTATEIPASWGSDSVNEPAGSTPPPSSEPSPEPTPTPAPSPSSEPTSPLPPTPSTTEFNWPLIGGIIGGVIVIGIIVYLLKRRVA